MEVIIFKHNKWALQVRAYHKDCSTDAEREKLLSGLTYEGGRKKVGPGVSKVIAALYDAKSYDIQ